MDDEPKKMPVTPLEWTLILSLLLIAAVSGWTAYQKDNKFDKAVSTAQ